MAGGLERKPHADSGPTSKQKLSKAKQQLGAFSPSFWVNNSEDVCIKEWAGSTSAH